MPLIIVSCDRQCFIEFEGTLRSCSPDSAFICSSDPRGELYFKQWGSFTYDKQIQMPSVFGIKIKSAVDDRSYGYSVEPMGCTVIDWHDIVQINAEPFLCCKEAGYGIVSFGSTVFNYKGVNAKAELYSDGLLRLMIDPGKGGFPFEYAFGHAEKGELSLYDVGKNRLLVVTATGSINRPGDNKSRLVILNENAEAILDITGDYTGIKDGYPVKVRRLSSFTEYEGITRFEYKNGVFSESGEEYGYYTRDRAVQTNNRMRALHFLEHVRCHATGEIMPMLAPELVHGLGFDEIKDYFGDFDMAILKPCLQEMTGRSDKLPDCGSVTVGICDHAIQNEFSGKLYVPKQVEFSFTGDLISNIEFRE